MVLTLAACKRSPHSSALNFSPMLGMYCELWKSSQIFLQRPEGKAAIFGSIQNFLAIPAGPKSSKGKGPGRVGFPLRLCRLHFPHRCSPIQRFH